MECKSCGAQIADESTYCPYCQAVISKPVATQAAANAQPTAAYQPKTKPKGEVWVLILLVLFFWPAAIWYAVTRDMSKSSGENKSSTGTNDAELRHLVPVGRSGLAIAAGYLALFSVLFIPAPFLPALSKIVSGLAPGIQKAQKPAPTQSAHILDLQAAMVLVCQIGCSILKPC